MCNTLGAIHILAKDRFKANKTDYKSVTNPCLSFTKSGNWLRKISNPGEFNAFNQEDATQLSTFRAYQQQNPCFLLYDSTS